MSMGAWAEIIYLDCGERLNTSKESYGKYGFLLLIDLGEKTHLTTFNPLEKMEKSIKGRLWFEEKTYGFDQAFKLKTDKGWLKIVDYEHKIYLGVEHYDGSGFIRDGVIDRVDLTFEDLLLSKTKHQCKLTNKYRYDSIIRNWQKKLDKDKQEYEEKRKF